MSFVGLLALPLLMTLGIAAATQGLLTRSPSSGGRTGAALLGVQVLVVAGMIGLTFAELARPREQRCPVGEGTWLLAVVLVLGASVVGGLLLATVIADGRKLPGVLVWHLVAAPAAIVLPYVAGFAYLYWGLTCTS